MAVLRKKLNDFFNLNQRQVILENIFRCIDSSYEHEGIKTFVVAGRYSKDFIAEIRSCYYREKNAPNILYYAGNFPSFSSYEGLRVYNVGEEYVASLLHYDFLKRFGDAESWMLEDSKV